VFQDPPLTSEAPSGAPPEAQPDALDSGPHTEKLTDPVGLPLVALPLTVASSVSAPPRAIDPLTGADEVDVDASPTVKHSSAPSSSEVV
jgi:hypothetical protein